MVAKTMDCPGPGKNREATCAMQATGPGGHVIKDPRTLGCGERRAPG